MIWRVLLLSDSFAHAVTSGIALMALAFAVSVSVTLLRGVVPGLISVGVTGGRLFQVMSISVLVSQSLTLLVRLALA